MPSPRRTRLRAKSSKHQHVAYFVPWEGRHSAFPPKARLFPALALFGITAFALPAPPEPGAAPSEEFIEAIYAAAELGGRLYDEGRYAEALPYLATAAERGMKVPQASLGDILLNGRGGVPRDTQAGIGWLAAAATPVTLPRIETYYERVLRELPPDYKETAARIAEAYRSAYDPAAHRVACRLHGNVVKELRCRFIDEADADADDYPDDVEEVVVTAPLITAPAPEIGQIPSGEFISQVYDAASRGSQLYREGKYKEALPLLLVAARRGFKWAQASAADILLHGRGGVPADMERGIGWLGVAAMPKTTNSMTQFFRDSKAKLPARFTPEAVDAIVSDYRAQYANLRHRVACRQRPTDPSWSLRVRSLRCHFIDEGTQCRNVVMDGDDMQWEWTCQPLEGARQVEARPF